MPATVKNGLADPPNVRGEKGGPRRLLILACIGFSGVAASLLILKAVPAPFVWMGWGWALVLFALSWRLQGGWARVVIFNGAVVIAMFAVPETYLSLKQRPGPTYAGTYYVADDVLGTAPVKKTRTQATEFGHGKLIYDVTYTIDANGLRIAPPSKTIGLEGSILFFGGSFTYGEGLQDNETLPYQVGIESKEQYEIYNFGFHGYGPHQMLAAIESGRVRQVVGAPPRYAIYEALPDHVARVAGKIPYGQHSPRYQIDADGTVRKHGHFDDGHRPPSAFERRMERQLVKSAIYRALKNLEPRTNESDLRLLLAIVGRSRDLLVAEYPGTEFHVILWRNFDYEQPTYRELQEGFAKLKIPTHLVEDILPDYIANPAQFWLGPQDRHPNALANRLFAKYVVTKILPSNTEGESVK